MHLLRRAYEFEYRSREGTDRLGTADLWADAGATRAVLVLRSVPTGESQRALGALNHSWLPYLLRPETALMVLSLRPRAAGQKARAVVLPLSA